MEYVRRVFESRYEGRSISGLDAEPKAGITTEIWMGFVVFRTNQADGYVFRARQSRSPCIQWPESSTGSSFRHATGRIVSPFKVSTWCPSWSESPGSPALHCILDRRTIVRNCYLPLCTRMLPLKLRTLISTPPPLMAPRAVLSSFSLVIPSDSDLCKPPEAFARGLKSNP